MRVGVIEKLIFPNGVYIFDSQGTQIDPKSPQGKILQGIYERQVKDKKDSLPQKYRAEVAHNKDINNDGIIGDPKSISVDAEVSVTPDSITIKPKSSRKKKKHSWN